MKRIGKVAYEMELPFEFDEIYPMFYHSMLKKCLGDPGLVILVESFGVKDSFSYKEIPVQILDYRLQVENQRDSLSESPVEKSIR